MAVLDTNISPFCSDPGQWTSIAILLFHSLPLRLVPDPPSYSTSFLRELAATCFSPDITALKHLHDGFAHILAAYDPVTDRVGSNVSPNFRSSLVSRLLFFLP